MKKLAILAVLIVFTLSLSACATARKDKEMEIQGLRNQITVLEAQIRSQDEEINELRDALAKTAEARETRTITKKRIIKKKIIGEIKSRPTTKQIQIALTNAGYDAGAIDGRMGKATKEAIRQFQRANNLPADGKVGHKTWELLRGYLYKKIK